MSAAALVARAPGRRPAIDGAPIASSHAGQRAGAGLVEVGEEADGVVGALVQRRRRLLEYAGVGLAVGRRAVLREQAAGVGRAALPQPCPVAVERLQAAGAAGELDLQAVEDLVRDDGLRSRRRA